MKKNTFALVCTCLPILNIIGLPLLIKDMVYLKKNNIFIDSFYYLFLGIGVVIAGLEIVLGLALTSALTDEYNEMNALVDKVELAYMSDKYMEQITMYRNIDDQKGYHIFDISKIELPEENKIESQRGNTYHGFIVINNLEYYRQPLIFVYTNKYEAINYNYYDKGTLMSNTESIKEYSNKEYTKEDVCNILGGNNCIYED